MKKSIIAAGAASVALAAMPIMGVFAVGNGGTITDRINASVTTSCSFARQATPHGNVGTWTTTDEPHSLNATALTLGEQNTLGSSKFTITCNDDDGYQVTIAADNLAIDGGNGSMTYSKTTTPGSGTAGTWYLSSNHTGLVTDHNVEADTVAYSTGQANADNFEVTYYAYPTSTQAGGAYTADVVYTFAQLGD